MPEAPEYLTAAEAAEYLRRPLQTLYWWRAQRVGPPALKARRSLLYRRSDLDAWLTEQSAA